ncbi:MAG: chemotaxis protein CheD [Fibrobacteres bacterium]|nr:chemotaxis protein CheD [Fibrobacterota bacterium]
MSDKAIVDIADMKVSSGEDMLITYALGSCIGVAAYDPVAKAGGLLHYMLPDSKIDSKKGLERPCMFADTGIMCMFRGLQQLGCQSNRLIVKIAGGSNILDPNGAFNIGKNNYLALKKVLWRFSILVKAEDVGGSFSRNMTLNLGNGEVRVRYAGEKEDKLL